MAKKTKPTTVGKSDNAPKRTLSTWRCHDCQAYFLADRLFDAARRAELMLLAQGYRSELPENFAEWCRCPECASGNIGELQEQENVEAGSIETVIDTACDLMDDLRSELPEFEESAEARRECMNLLWNLCASLSRGCELARNDDKLRELVREFGCEEGGNRWVRRIEEKKIRPPVKL